MTKKPVNKKIQAVFLLNVHKSVFYNHLVCCITTPKLVKTTRIFVLEIEVMQQTMTQDHFLNHAFIQKNSRLEAQITNSARFCQFSSHLMPLLR